MYVKETKGPWKPFTIANFITYAGFIFLALSIWCASQGEKNLTFFYFLLAAITDYYDGKIARSSEAFLRAPVLLGGFYREPENFADRILQNIDILIEELREKAKKIPWFFGISRLGEILDPIRDKLLLIPAIITEPYLIGIILVEIISSVAAIVVRDIKGFHFITDASKTATFFQLGMVLLLFLMPTPLSSHIMAGLIYVCSLARCLSYCKEIARMSETKEEALEERSKAA